MTVIAAAELHTKLEELRNGRAPLPLTDGQATAQAVRLRVKHGLSYTALARILGEYHGVWLSADGWKSRCRRQGVAPHNHGRPFPSGEKS